jgi:hypothetical protein
VIWKIPALLAEFSGGQTRLAQTVPALFLNSSPRLGHVEWADPAITKAMRFPIFPLVLLVQHAGGATDVVVNQQQPSAGWLWLGAFSIALGQDH